MWQDFVMVVLQHLRVQFRSEGKEEQLQVRTEGPLQGVLERWEGEQAWEGRPTEEVGLPVGRAA